MTRPSLLGFVRLVLDDNPTDVGTFGPLEENFDVDISYLAEGPRFDGTTQRQGVDRWLLIDGSDLPSPIELADFTATDADKNIPIRLRTGACPVQ